MRPTKATLRKRLDSKVEDFLKSGGEITKVNEGGYIQERDGYRHRKIYERRYGKIPDGYDVHHIDGNPGNNDPENLIALRQDVHQWMHTNGGRYVTAMLKRHHLKAFMDRLGDGDLQTFLLAFTMSTLKAYDIDIL
jgi:hypothetical protein